MTFHYQDGPSRSAPGASAHARYTTVAVTIPVLFMVPKYPVMTGKLPAWTCQPICGSCDPKYCRVAEEAIAALPNSHKAQGARVRISENRNCRCF